MQSPKFSVVLVLGLLLVILAPFVTAPLFAQGSGLWEEPGAPTDAQFVLPPDVGVEGIVSPLSLAFSGSPAYDSGWVSLEQDEARTLTHNLGRDVDDYVVDMQYRTGDFNRINLRYYGGVDFNSFGGSGEGDRTGAYWRNLTTSSVTVYRRPEDAYAEEVRIRIWIDPDPDWIAAGSP